MEISRGRNKEDFLFFFFFVNVQSYFHIHQKGYKTELSCTHEQTIFIIINKVEFIYCNRVEMFVFYVGTMKKTRVFRLHGSGIKFDSCKRLKRCM